MSTAPAGGSSGVGYARGVPAAEVNVRRVGQVALVATLIGLAVLTIAMVVSASGQSSRLDQLRRHGVPVTARVTGCRAVSSGVGMGLEYWECRATYDLGGNQYSAVIGGNRSFLDTGRAVPAIAVPGKPAVLSEPGAAAKPPSGLGAYTAPIILGAVIVVTVAAWVIVARLRGRRGRKS